ncbi:MULTISPECIES: hypothetical protein [unclassified Knoellia]|uniref:hypothetical protein n=1 Tax=Knoellia altitudinis TaxID=3404795 RepID=UPI00360A62CE
MNARPASSVMDLSQLSTPQLLETYGRVLAELRYGRGVLRTNNPPAGDYAEWLMWKSLGGVLADNSAKSFDIDHPEHGLIQVKARVVSDKPTAGQQQTSPFRSWAFDQAGLVLFDPYYVVRRAVLLPREVVEPLGTWRQHVRGWTLSMSGVLMGHEAATDVTPRLRAVAARTEA